MTPHWSMPQHRCLWSLCHAAMQDGQGHLAGSISATVSLKMAMPLELSLLQPCLLEELFVLLTPAINFEARRSHYGWLAGPLV